MTTALAKDNVTAIAAKSAPSLEGIEQVLIAGDLAKLSTEQRISYYKRVCESTGLNPLTQPFEYIALNGKLVLYARKAASDQLRMIHGVSVKIVARETIGDIHVVTARATLRDGREDESTGAVSMGGLKGEALANALMKAETKAKRRVTLSICGLSMLDETEVDSIPGAQRVDGKHREPAPRRTLDDVAQAAQEVPAHDKQTGEVLDAEWVGTVPEPTSGADEYGLTVPAFSCPIFEAGKHPGKSYMDVPAGYLRWLVAQDNFKRNATAPQRAWAEYAIARHEAEKAAKGESNV